MSHSSSHLTIKVPQHPDKKDIFKGNCDALQYFKAQNSSIGRLKLSTGDNQNIPVICSQKIRIDLSQTCTNEQTTLKRLIKAIIGHNQFIVETSLNSCSYTSLVPLIPGKSTKVASEADIVEAELSTAWCGQYSDLYRPSAKFAEYTFTANLNGHFLHANFLKPNSKNERKLGTIRTCEPVPKPGCHDNSTYLNQNAYYLIFLTLQEPPLTAAASRHKIEQIEIFRIQPKIIHSHGAICLEETALLEETMGAYVDSHLAAFKTSPEAKYHNSQKSLARSQSVPTTLCKLSGVLSSPRNPGSLSSSEEKTQDTPFKPSQP